MNIIHSPSPNFNTRAQDATIKYIVLHYTDMVSAQDALKRLQDPSSQVSAHYLVDEDGHIMQLVDEAKRAWHAGQSSWKNERDINSLSIGIEIANPGHLNGYRPFPQGQTLAVRMLATDIKERYGLPATCLLAHSDVAPDRKADPGELFPWQDFARAGLGLWPTPQPDDYADAKDGELADLLRKIGYDALDETACDAAVTAFQRRYRPTSIDGFADAETLALVRALARMV